MVRLNWLAPCEGATKLLVTFWSPLLTVNSSRYFKPMPEFVVISSLRLTSSFVPCSLVTVIVYSMSPVDSLIFPCVFVTWRSFVVCFVSSIVNVVDILSFHFIVVWPPSPEDAWAALQENEILPFATFFSLLSIVPLSVIWIVILPVALSMT